MDLASNEISAAVSYPYYILMLSMIKLNFVSNLSRLNSSGCHFRAAPSYVVHFFFAVLVDLSPTGFSIAGPSFMSNFYSGRNFEQHTIIAKTHKWSFARGELAEFRAVHKRVWFETTRVPRSDKTKGKKFLSPSGPKYCCLPVDRLSGGGRLTTLARQIDVFFFDFFFSLIQYNVTLRKPDERSAIVSPRVSIVFCNYRFARQSHKTSSVPIVRRSTRAPVHHSDVLFFCARVRPRRPLSEVTSEATSPGWPNPPPSENVRAQPLWRKPEEKISLVSNLTTYYYYYNFRKNPIEPNEILF